MRIADPHRGSPEPPPLAPRTDAAAPDFATIVADLGAAALPVPARFVDVNVTCTALSFSTKAPPKPPQAHQRARTAPRYAGASATAPDDASAPAAATLRGANAALPDAALPGADARRSGAPTGAHDQHRHSDARASRATPPGPTSAVLGLRKANVGARLDGARAASAARLSPPTYENGPSGVASCVAGDDGAVIVAAVALEARARDALERDVRSLLARYGAALSRFIVRAPHAGPATRQERTSDG